MFDIVALGEILIDFTPAGKSEFGNLCFERNPGGAPANVLACVSRFGGQTAFIGKVGDDIFGHYLDEVLKSLNIETSGLKFTDKAKTTLAFVQLDDKGDRSFSFYRNPGADTTLSIEDIDFELIKKSKIFHFGSLSLTHEPSRSATFYALDQAVKSGCIISYDPNLRLPLWENANSALEGIKSALKFASILKISEEELEFITGEKDLDAGSLKLQIEYGISMIFITLGKNGSYYRFGSLTGRKETFNQIEAIDTTGAGDAFLGGVLYYLLKEGITSVKQLNKKIVENAVIFANATASLCTAKRGAIPAMPDLNSVLKLINT